MPDFRLGSGVYFTNPNQIQKFSVNSELNKAHAESAGKLFQVHFTLVVLLFCLHRIGKEN